MIKLAFFPKNYIDIGLPGRKLVKNGILELYLVKFTWKLNCSSLEHNSTSALIAQLAEHLTFFIWFEKWFKKLSKCPKVLKLFKTLIKNCLRNCQKNCQNIVQNLSKFGSYKFASKRIFPHFATIQLIVNIY